MKKSMGFRCLSVVLMFILLLPSVIMAREATPRAQQLHLVICIDRSGSMYGTPMNAAKSVAARLARTVLEANPSSEVGITDFSYDARVVHPMSGDIASLEAGINTVYALGNTNVEDGLAVSYDEILKANDPSVRNVIVLLGDGLPNAGKRQPGFYDEKNWGYEMYHYGSASVYTAQSIWPNCDIYTVGFFHNSNARDTERGYRLLADIQNYGYFNAQDADDLEQIFDEIGDDLVNEVPVESFILTPNPMHLPNVGDTGQIVPVFTPPNATNKSISYTSTNEGIATVNPLGLVTAVGEGSCEIIGRSVNGKTASLAVYVGQATPVPTPTPTTPPTTPTPTPTQSPTTPTPTPSVVSPIKVTILPNPANVGVGESLQLKASVSPSGADQKVAWKSMHPDIFSVSSTGMIQGIKKGSGVVQAIAANGIVGMGVVHVGGEIIAPEGDGKTNYYALALGYSEFAGTGDYVRGVGANLRYIEGHLEEYTQYSDVTVKTNRKLSQTKNDIKLAFKKADADDVSLLYINGWGNRNKAGNVTIRTSDDQYWSIKSLRAWLDVIPGKIVVLLDLSYSGGFISKGANDMYGEREAFNADVLSAFSEGKAGSRALNNKKYLVLTSNSEYEFAKFDNIEDSNGYSLQMGHFTYHLLMGIQDGNADASGDNQIDFTEMYNYVVRHGAHREDTDTVGVYPRNDTSLLFDLK